MRNKVDRALGASAAKLGLVEQFDILSVAMTMLTFGRLGDFLGHKTVFLLGLIVPHPERSEGHAPAVLSGCRTSMMLAGSLALVAAAYPAEVRGMKIGIVSACTCTGLSAGPVHGGYVTDHFGWRSVFLMSAPLGFRPSSCASRAWAASGTMRLASRWTRAGP